MRCRRYSYGISLSHCKFLLNSSKWNTGHSNIDIRNDLFFNISSLKNHHRKRYSWKNLYYLIRGTCPVICWAVGSSMTGNSTYALMMICHLKKSTAGDALALLLPIVGGSRQTRNDEMKRLFKIVRFNRSIVFFGEISSELRILKIENSQIIIIIIFLYRHHRIIFE